MKRTCFFIFFFLLLLIPVNSVKAQEANKHKVSVEIAEKGTAKITLDFNLLDKGSANYFAGFELLLPFQNIKNISTSINSQNISPIIEQVETGTKLVFGAERLLVNIDDNTSILISFEADNISVERFGLNYIYIPEFKTNFNLEELEYTINYPQTFNSLSFVSSERYENVNNKLDFVANGAALVIWGESSKVNLEMDYLIENKQDISKVYLLNSFSNNGQRVTYSQLPLVSGALSDKWGNNFFVKSLTTSTKEDLNFKITVEKSSSPHFEEANTKYGWVFNQDNQLVKDYSTLVEDSMDKYTKLKIFNDFLVDKIDPYSLGKVSVNLLDNIWAKIDGRTKLNSFEYTYLLVTLAENLGVDAHLNYGYLLLPQMFTTGAITPHVWAEVKIDNNVYLFDPYIEDISKVSFYGKHANDRILVGTWHPSQDYNNVLGLLSESSEDLQIKFVDLGEPEASASIDLTFTPPDTIYSGDIYNADVVIKNNSDYLIPLRNLTIDGTSFIDQIKVRDFYPALLPRKETTFNINNLVNSDLSIGSVKKIKLSIDLGSFKNIDSKASFETEEEVFSTISLSYVLTFLSGLLILIALSWFLIRQLFKFFTSRKV